MKQYDVMGFSYGISWISCFCVDDLKNYGSFWYDVSSETDSRFKFEMTILKPNFFVISKKKIGKVMS